MMEHFSDLSQHLLYHLFRPQGFQGCQRFGAFRPPDKFRLGSSYGGSPDCINFTVIVLHAVQHFGSKGASYAVSTEVKDTTDGCSVVKTIGLVRSRKWQGFFYCFSVQFYRPACLVRKKKKYKLASLINGPTSWKGLGYIPLG